MRPSHFAAVAIILGSAAGGACVEEAFVKFAKAAACTVCPPPLFSGCVVTHLGCLDDTRCQDGHWIRVTAAFVVHWYRITSLEGFCNIVNGASQAAGRVGCDCKLSAKS